MMQKILEKVMLVDDDHITNFINQRLLRKAAREVVVALNGKEAIQLLRESLSSAGSPALPDLILLDINMPVMNGFEFLEQYRQLPVKGIPIAMLTTSSNEKDIARARRFNIFEFIDKPLSDDKIRRIFDKYF
jgi:CheY-like chemotaxis protein